MQTETTHLQQDDTCTMSARERLQGVVVVLASAAVMIGLALGATALFSSPAGWMMKAANQAISDHQQAVATSFAMNVGE